MKILIVDDEPDTRESLCELLEFAGYNVVKTESGQEALKVLDAEDGEIGLMLVDFMMPGMDGEELLRKVRSGGHNPKALILTAMAPWKTAGLTGMGIGYIRKPYDGNILLTTIASLMRKE